MHPMKSNLKKEEMAYIPLEEHLPGITGLLEYRRDTAEPIRELTQFLLRGPSTMSAAERELIAVAVSSDNSCLFCSNAHRAIASQLLGENETVMLILRDPASAPVNAKMKALLTVARQVAESGKMVTPAAIEKARAEGASDVEIHDTVLISALFCLYNRYVDGLAVNTPEDPGYYASLAERIANNGYRRLKQGYNHLKTQHK